MQEILTTPTLTLSGLGSARKASVTPRIGSLAAGSTWRHHAVDMDRAAPNFGRRPDDPTRMRCAIWRWRSAAELGGASIECWWERATRRRAQLLFYFPFSLSKCVIFSLRVGTKSPIFWFGCGLRRRFQFTWLAPVGWLNLLLFDHLLWGCYGYFSYEFSDLWIKRTKQLFSTFQNKIYFHSQIYNPIFLISFPKR